MFAQTSCSNCVLFFIAVFGVLVQVAHAMPMMRDVYVPRVTYPCKGTVWHRGQIHNVTWDVSSPPEKITNPKGKIYLRKGERTGPTILAQGFDITDGSVSLTLPHEIESGEDYKVVLFGDSGNFSDEFTIA